MESPAGSYTQLIPSVDGSSRPSHRHGLPPSLPPQLLQVLLAVLSRWQLCLCARQAGLSVCTAGGQVVRRMVGGVV